MRASTDDDARKQSRLRLRQYVASARLSSVKDVEGARVSEAPICLVDDVFVYLASGQKSHRIQEGYQQRDGVGIICRNIC